MDITEDYLKSKGFLSKDGGKHYYNEELRCVLVNNNGGYIPYFDYNQIDTTAVPGVQITDTQELDDLIEFIGSSSKYFKYFSHKQTYIYL